MDRETKSVESSVSNLRRRKLDELEDEIYDLYYNQGKTQRVIAMKYGVGEATLSRFFQKNGWISRNPRRGLRKRVFENDEEREEARKQRRKDTQRRIRELRTEIFGTECELCGNERTLAIHKKNGEEHERDALWRIKYLEDLDREEWAPLCIPCHRGTHWLMQNANKEWDDIESRRESIIDSSEGTLEPLTREDYENTSYRNGGSGMNAKEVRESLFGNSCHFCGEIPKRKRMVIHRKDGRRHDERILSSAKYLKRINPDNWVGLCNKCHRQTTWSKDILGMDWDDLD